ncbi:MAG: hypothetical protein ACP5XB_04315 [Isosphaeraceae bacterium]
MAPADFEYPELTRRSLLKKSGLTALGSQVATALHTEGKALAASSASNKTIGIQVGSVSFVDEGVEQVLDVLRERGRINTIFLTTFTYGRGLAGRQIPGHPFPDHGVRATDEAFFHGGNYARPHSRFYSDTILKKTRAPDHGDLDIVEAVLPAAKKRGIRVFCSCEDQWRSTVPGFDKVAEVDLQGRRAGTLCLMNPDVRHFWTALVTDLCSSYDIDGILFFNERNGSLLNATGSSHSQQIASAHTTCFCEHHRGAAREHGIDFERAREGYRQLDAFVKAALADRRPSDGYFVAFWRLLMEYPEIIAWDKLFDAGKHQVLAEVRAAVKAIRPGLEVGFHIEHVNSFNPIFRATRSYAELAGLADFLKVVVYNNCGGERYRHYINNIGATVFRDVPKDDLLRLHNHLLGYGQEASLEALPGAGLSPDYIARETKRALQGAGGKCRILPGIDIGIPTGRTSRKASPADTYAAVAAALKAGSGGVILSRKYSEMRLDNLSAAGRAVQDCTA